MDQFTKVEIELIDGTRFKYEYVNHDFIVVDSFLKVFRNDVDGKPTVLLIPINTLNYVTCY